MSELNRLNSTRALVQANRVEVISRPSSQLFIYRMVVLSSAIKDGGASHRAKAERCRAI